MKRLHPDCDLLFAFDNSMSHHKRHPNGLDASLLNLSDGGAQVPKMRNTQFIQDIPNPITNIPNQIIVEQQMQHENGIQKGLKTILIERKLWPITGLKKKMCILD